jgi:hypothetical protein
LLSLFDTYVKCIVNYGCEVWGFHKFSCGYWDITFMFFLFRSEFFFRTTRELEYLIFFQNLTLGYMTKALNQIFFFSSTKIRIFFSATLGIRIFFFRKKHNPPCKLNGPSLGICMMTITGNFIYFDQLVIWLSHLLVDIA